MPFLTPGQWEKSIYEKVDKLIPDTIIPLYDEDVYKYFPNQHWLFNKLYICEALNYKCSPHGIMPTEFPVYSRPAYGVNNSYIDGEIWQSEKDVKFKSGYFWMPLFSGEYSTIDVLIKDNEILWSSVTHGKIDKDSKITELTTNPHISIKNYPQLIDFVERKIYRTYVGAMNFELIGRNIIDIHPRFNTQLVEFYPPKFLEAVAKLYRDGDDVPSRKLGLTRKGSSLPVWSRTSGVISDVLNNVQISTRTEALSLFKRKWYMIGYTNTRI